MTAPVELSPEVRQRIAQLTQDLNGTDLTEAARRVRAQAAMLRRQAGRHIGYETPGDLAAALDPRFVRTRLTGVLDEVMVKAMAGKTDRILITTPPQVGKSVTAAEWTPLWWLQQRPEDRVVVASYAAHLARRRGRRVRNLITAHPDQLGLYLAGDSKAADTWDLIDGGGMMTVGVGGGLTGNPAHLLIVDDPIKDDRDATSVVIRERLWEWWTSTALARLQARSVVVLVQTRWHPDDLAGRLIEEEGDRWQIINVPAIAETDPDPLGRKIGEAIDRPDEPDATEFYESIRLRVGSRVWSSLYQQHPTPPEGGLWTWAQIRAARSLPAAGAPIKTAVAIDPSASGELGTDEAGIIGGSIDREGIVTILEDRSGRMAPDQWAREAWQLALAIGAGTVVYESNLVGKMMETVLRAAWEAMQREGTVPLGVLMPRLKGVHASVGKSLRAEPVAQMYAEERVRHRTVFPELEAQMTAWMPGQASPDRLDSLTHLCTYLFGSNTGPVRTGSPATRRLPGSNPGGRR